MNITKRQFNALVNAVWLHRDTFEKLNEEEQKAIIDAQVVIVELESKRRKDNEKVSAYIAEKRKTDKNYARKKEGKK